MTEDEMVGWHHRFDGHAGALSSLALTRCTDFFALGHGVQRGGCEALLVARGRELAGGGGASECARREPGLWGTWLPSHCVPLSSHRTAWYCWALPSANAPGKAPNHIHTTLRWGPSRQEYWSGLPFPSPG